MENEHGINFMKYVMGSDMDFFEEHLADFSEEELQKFLDENPDFLKE